MSRAPQTFRQRDVTRAVKAVVAAGLDISRVEIDKQGSIIVVPGKLNPAIGSSSSWDAAIAELKSR